MSRCKPGDLAVVISAANPANIGRIVKVIAPHDGEGRLGLVGPKPVWLVSAPTPLTWRDGAKRHRLKKGPVPDSQLQPIRGQKSPVTQKHHVKQDDFRTRLALKTAPTPTQISAIVDG
jgi:hypothetical protein